MKLSGVQAAYLREQPLGTAANKVGLALGLVQRTQAELAAAAGVTASDLSDIRNGKYRRLALTTAQRISAVFGVCTDDIFPRLTTTRGARRSASKHVSKSKRSPKAEAA